MEKSLQRISNAEQGCSSKSAKFHARRFVLHIFLLSRARARAFEGTTKPNTELKSSLLKHFDPLFGDRPRDKAKVSVRSSNVASKIDRSAIRRDEDGRFYVRTMLRKHSNTVSFLFSNISSSDEESAL